MLPKPKFDAIPRPTFATNSSSQQFTPNCLQYANMQSLNQTFVNNYPTYGHNYPNNYQLSNNFQSTLWYQNNYNSNYNFNVNNVWNGFNNQNSIRFNQNYNQNYRQFPQNDYQNKRFKDNHQKSVKTSNKTFNCDACNRWFPTQQQYDQHLSEHILCGLDECTFRAHPKVIENHQRMQHFCFKDRSLVKKFMSLDTEEDIEKWKEERRRHFPTKDNIKKKQELEEIKRLKDIEEKQQLNQNNDKQKDNQKESEKSFKQKSKKNKKSLKAKEKRFDTFKNNRKLTLFQKLMMNEKQEIEDKDNEKVNELQNN